MQDLNGVESLLDPDGNCTHSLFNMFITGRASPYFHNGSLNIQQEGTDKIEERYVRKERYRVLSKTMHFD